MDIKSFGLDERLVAAAPGLAARANLHEKMLSHAVAKGDNVLAKIEVPSGREEISLLPALQWLLSSPEGEQRRVLVAAADRAMVDAIAAVARRLASGLPRGAEGGLGLIPCLVTPAEDSEGGAGAAPVLEGDPGSPLLIGLPSSLLSAAESGLFSLKDFGFLILEGGERLAELPSELLKAFSAALLPSWERRCIVVCSKISVKAKNLAWELADNPVEIHLEEEAAKAQGIAQESWHIAGDAKLRFLLGLLTRSAPARLLVFCNLKSSAEELALRLQHNGVPSDYILGALPQERKSAIVEKLRSGESRVLVLTDQGAEGLAAASFPLIVNFEIPLEPEFYMKRLELLERSNPAAKVVNLACDRYAVGLPAIESYIDASLAAKPVDAPLLEAEDLSAAFVYERPRADRSSERGAQGDTRRGGSRSSASSRASSSRAGRLVPPERRPPQERANEGRRDAPRDTGRSDSRRGREGGRPAEDRDREDRRPEIWRSIAEATGGAFGRENKVAGNAPKAPSGREAEGPRDKERSGGRPGESGRSQGRDGRRSNQNKQSAKPREAERSGKRAAEEPKSKAPARGRGKSANNKTENAAPAAAGNPYDLPMEERMRLYREKYGARLDAKGKSAGRSKTQGQGKGAAPGGNAKTPPSGEGNRSQDGRASQGRAKSQTKDARGASTSRNPGPPAAPGANRNSARGPSAGGERGRAGNASGANGRQPRPSAQAPRPAPLPAVAPAKPSVLGKLFGLFKKKDS